MRKLTKVLSVTMGIAMSAVMVGTAAGCGGGGGSGEIKFWYSASISDNKIIREMVDAYNKGQGVEDGVTVKPDNRQQIDRSSLFVDAPNVLMFSDKEFKGYAVEGLYQDITDYYNEMPGNYKEEDVPKTLTERFRIDTANNADGKRMAGKDAAIQGVPFGNTPMVYYYSKPAFASQKINIISCEEEKLSQEYPKVRPHGYAEYLEAPYEGAEKSANLAGEEVYKVFNNRIPMNWEEFRYLSKCFTDGYNPGSTTETGSGTHWWFSYGWSVGGDCVGYNEAEKKYEFTVADASKNYLVVAADGVTVGETSYAAGEIVRYADKSRITEFLLSGKHWRNLYG